ncbi:MAG TPA: sugar nucleotide-binding protein [Caulobacter sp.]|nr:sugar nucleotide-binding protein [Caulobacter sp.]
MPELWGGHECTITDCGLGRYDQTRRCGHHERLEDLDAFADLGLKTLRYPLLWEQVSPDRPDQRDWAWTDRRFGRLRELGVRPIAGLVHHGAGPAYTSLLDPDFATGLADHAAASAERYPWIDAWTPVNEPLTTARFACLYGHWRPFKQEERLFWTALLNELDGVKLAMRAVRRVNPAAQLIQTEDLGRTYATPPLRDQCEHDNARRWMTWDLLCGRVTREHPMFERLARLGLGDRLRRFADEPCPPDVIGVNHYLTSDRFLDHRLERYPAERHGGNGLVAYADVEAARVLVPGPDLMEGALREACARYDLPVAVTEAHNACTREEQLRWIHEAWTCASRLESEGLPVRAVTVWSLLGAYDWNSLMTRWEGYYETGAFDLRGGRLRRTAVADLIRRLIDGRPVDPLVEMPGWWRRDVRLTFPPVEREAVAIEPRKNVRTAGGHMRPLLITGASGTLGKAFARACDLRGLDYVLTDRTRLPLCDADLMAQAIDELAPSAVINTAGYVRVDDAEAEEAACMASNFEGAVRLAEACRERELPFVTFSTDLVFDGEADRPYLEGDTTAPLNVYGRSKALAERRIAALGGKALVIRTAAFFAAADRYNFAAAVENEIGAGRDFFAAEDIEVSPTHVPDLVNASLDLLIDGETGVWHLANEGRVSWAQFARAIARRRGLDHRKVVGRAGSEMNWRAPRPRLSALASTRGALLPTLDEGIARYAMAMRA